MSDKALRILKHMRQQIVRRSERYVAVREAAMSIGVDPDGSECASLVEELLRGGHLPTLPQPQSYRARPVPTHRPGYSRSRRGRASVPVA